MKYWSLSDVRNSGLLGPEAVWQLTHVCSTGVMSSDVFHVCADAALRLEPTRTPLVIVQTVGAPLRRVYLDYPAFDDWLRLERGGFVQGEDDSFGFVIDALH